MLRRLIKVLLARKRDPGHWRAESQRWRRLANRLQNELATLHVQHHTLQLDILQHQRQQNADLLDRALERSGSAAIQQQPEKERQPTAVDPEEMSPADFEQWAHQQDFDQWLSRASHDPAARMYVEQQAPSNPHFAAVLAKLPNARMN